MNADQTACASSGKASARDQIGWPKSERLVRRLQARIVKVTRAIPALTGPVHAGLCNGLSRMKGNFHVRFLGEGWRQRHLLTRPLTEARALERLEPREA